MLHEPRPVGLDRAQRVQVAEQVERDLLVAVRQLGGLVHERLEHQSFDVRPRGTDHVVLHPGEDLTGVHPVVDAALEPARDPTEHVVLAEAQHGQLVLRVEQPGLLVPAVLAAGQQVADPLEQLVHAGLLQHGLDAEVGDELHHPELVEVLEPAGVVGEQALGHQLQQHVVVALERREDVGVGLERCEPVLRQVARTATGLAALLDGAGGVPGAERLGAGRAGLEQPTGLLGVGRLLGLGEHFVQLAGQDLLHEVQGIRAREQRKEPTLVQAVVEQQLLVVLAGRLELAPLQRVLRRDRQRHLGRVDAGAADTYAALHEGAEHREEAAVGVVDLALVAALGRHVGEPVEQGSARHPDAVEPDPPVVDAVEAHLRAVVLDPYAGTHLALLADRHHEGVHAFLVAAELELCEDHRQLAVRRGVADVVLVGQRTRWSRSRTPATRRRTSPRCRGPARCCRGRSRSSRSSPSPCR